MSDLEVLALQLAASGCVSGELSEWPYLRSAFAALGRGDVPVTLGVPGMRALSRELLAELERGAA